MPETLLIERAFLDLYFWKIMQFHGAQKQPISTLSTYEAEYVATTSCACHATWLRNLLRKLYFEKKRGYQDDGRQ